MTRHKIGSTRTIETAILVCEYLKLRCAHPHSTINEGAIRYVFTNPTPDNGFWSADIIVDTYSTEYDEKVDSALTLMVNTCRAFVAGRGEVWA